MPNQSPLLPKVLRFHACNQTALTQLLRAYQIQLITIADDQPIIGSFWGDDEAGIIQNNLYARNDTPIHSILHEVGHYICMDKTRRVQLHTNAGGGYNEENAVCYLQILLAKQLYELGSKGMMQDMDAWGYSFRLGSTQAWFTQDADDAKHWLIQKNLIDRQSNPTYQLRQ